jgi:glycosyltransferase involved in cell wall biosynthesis
MKVALLTDGIHPFIVGGMQKHSFYLAKYFAANQVYVDLYHPAIGITETEFLNCFTSEERAYIRPFFVEFPKSIYFPGHYLYESYKYSKNILEKYFQSDHPDFVYAQGFCAWALMKYKKDNPSEIKTPVAVNFHGLNMFQKAFGINNRLNNILFRPFVTYNLNHADLVFSLGESLSQLIQENTSARKVVEVPVGIDSSWLIETPRPVNKVLKFVFIGRNDKVKGIDVLNKAIQNLLAKNIAFQFDFIGPFPADQQLSHQQLNYHGEIKDIALLKNIMEYADVIVSSSYSEGMPTVIIEAMACGLAVVVTDVGAVRELVDDSNGLLIPPGDIAAIEKSLTDFIQMPPPKIFEMKKASLEKVKEKFLWQQIIKQTIDVIEKMKVVKK